MADKARSYLEQTIPDLKQLEKKGIFTKTEIGAITKKRSEFEHKVNTSGCKAIDYARYLEYEMNLEALRKKRVQRLAIKSRPEKGQRHIFFLFERATRKFYGDLGLWMQYIEFAKKEKASNVLMKIFASVLKLHPMKPELWIYAARHSVEVNADMTEARSFMQRGIRFNKQSKQMWLEYTKLELMYVAKIVLRRQLLGIDGIRGSTKDVLVGDNDEDDEMIELPAITAEEMSPESEKEITKAATALDDIENNPALNGAVPLAIFDEATKEIAGDVKFVYSFFDLFTSSTSLHCLQKLLQHVVDKAMESFPSEPLTYFMYIKSPLVGKDATDPTFPSTLGVVLSRFTESSLKVISRSELYSLFTTWLLELLALIGLDPAVQKVIKGALKKYLKEAESGGYITPELYQNWLKLSDINSSASEKKTVFDKAQKLFPTYQFTTNQLP